MKILHEIWHYWKSLSVWFCTAFVVLVLLTVIINHFKTPSGTSEPDPAAQCLDDGGTWNAEEAHCRFPA
ncbi:MAG: hypothetical protein DI626_09705 [Micavibrio aeruginosavorus]|uniref:Uncharacterized protein n=1 Tax=Micavibrio aeruginosavorus TaxID=349221 RepID=A0A2W4ZRP2_9BACT|nr:MAG: hypothetical protein DI626_09705 [Micavibrio aeruginosavorus]